MAAMSENVSDAEEDAVFESLHDALHAAGADTAPMIAYKIKWDPPPLISASPPPPMPVGDDVNLFEAGTEAAAATAAVQRRCVVVYAVIPRHVIEDNSTEDDGPAGYGDVSAEEHRHMVTTVGWFMRLGWDAETSAIVSEEQWQPEEFEDLRDFTKVFPPTDRFHADMSDALFTLDARDVAYDFRLRSFVDFLGACTLAGVTRALGDDAPPNLSFATNVSLPTEAAYYHLIMQGFVNDDADDAAEHTHDDGLICGHCCEMHDH